MSTTGLITGAVFGSHPGLMTKQNLSVETVYYDQMAEEEMKARQNSQNYFFPYLEVYVHKGRGDKPIIQNAGFAVDENGIVITKITDKPYYGKDGRHVTKKLRMSEKMIHEHTDPGFKRVISNLRGLHISMDELRDALGIDKSTVMDRDKVIGIFFSLKPSLQQRILAKHWRPVGVSLYTVDLTNNNTENGNSARGILRRPDFACQNGGTTTFRSGGHLPIPPLSKIIFKPPVPADILMKDEDTSNNAGLSSKDKILPGTYPLLPSDYVCYEEIMDSLENAVKARDDDERRQAIGFPNHVCTQIGLKGNGAGEHLADMTTCIVNLAAACMAGGDNNIENLTPDDLKTIVTNLNNSRHAIQRLLHAFSSNYQEVRENIFATALTHVDPYREGDMYIHRQ